MLKKWISKINLYFIQRIFFSTTNSPSLIFRIISLFPLPYLPRINFKEKILKEGKIQLHFSRFERLYFYSSSIEFRFNQLLKEYCIDNSVLLNMDKDGLIIDCGANIGEFSLALNFINQNNNFLCFEPDPVEFETLTKNLENFNSTLRNEALSDVEGIKRFFLNNSTGDSTLLEDSPSPNSVDVKCVTLDGTLLNIDRIELLKLEAEGHEVEILQGALNSLFKIKFITIDAGFERNGKSTFHDCTKILLDNGFELYNFSSKRHSLIFKNLSL